MSFPKIKVYGLVTLPIALAILVVSCQRNQTATRSAHTASPGTEGVTDARLVNSDREPENWLSYGRTYSEQRFSPLKSVSDKNMNQLGLAWSFDLDTLFSGLK